MNWYKKWSNTHLFRILGAQSLNADAKLYLISSKFHFHFSQHSSNLDHFPIWTILSHLLLRTFLNFSNWSHHCSEKMIYDLSVASTKTKYIKLNTKTQNIFCCFNENLTTFLYTLKEKTFFSPFVFLSPLSKCTKKSSNFHLKDKKYFGF